MTLFIIQVVFLAALLITAIISFSGIKKADPDYKPMMLFCIFSFVFETLIFVFAYQSTITKILINMQYLMGTFLIFWQARKWKLFQKMSSFKLILLFMLAVWLIELFITKQSTKKDIPLFTLIYALIIVLIAIELIKRQISFEPGALLKNPIVLFSMGLVFYYTFSLVLDVFMITGQYSDQGVLQIVYMISVALGLITNFIYLKAVLCTPKIID
jgi:hypothetical protein